MSMAIENDLYTDNISQFANDKSVLVEGIYKQNIVIIMLTKILKGQSNGSSRVPVYFIIAIMLVMIGLVI